MTFARKPSLWEVCFQLTVHSVVMPWSLCYPIASSRAILRIFYLCFLQNTVNDQNISHKSRNCFFSKSVPFNDYQRTQAQWQFLTVAASILDHVKSYQAAVDKRLLRIRHQSQQFIIIAIYKKKYYCTVHSLKNSVPFKTRVREKVSF